MADAVNTGLPPGIVPQPYVLPGQMVCFICLETNADNPNRSWCHPCNCSLRSHPECFLRWIDEEAAAQRRRFRPTLSPQCPACKHPIVVELPYDPVLALRNALYRRYSHLSPLILLAFFVGGGAAGSAAYGWLAASIFAGKDSLSRWLAEGSRVHHNLPLGRYLKLALIAPHLIFMGALPNYGTALAMPFAFAYGGWVFSTEGPLDWPPSPSWTVALMPNLHFTYRFVWNEVFGSLERRLNSVLLGRNPEPLEPPAAADAVPGGQDQPGAAPPAEIVADVEGPNLLDQVEDAGDRVGNAIDNIVDNIVYYCSRAVALFNGEDGLAEDEENRGNRRDGAVAIELDVGARVNIGGAGEDNADVAGVEQADYRAAPAGRLAQPPAAAAPIAAPAQDPPPPPPWDPVAANANADRPAPPGEDEPAPPGQDEPAPPRQYDARFGEFYHPRTLCVVSNNIVSSLLLPVISYGMGHFLFSFIPRLLTHRILSSRSGRREVVPATGFLGLRWGRSLAGGCLFLVLKDVLSLWIKYRRVEVRRRRRIRNMEE